MASRGHVPLVALATLAYAAGLIAGFAGRAALAVACAAAVLAVAASRRDARAAGLALVVAAGALIAADDRRELRRCLTTAARAGAWTVRLAGDASPGAFVRGAIVPCGAPVRLAVTSGRAPEGATVRVAGAPAAGPTALLVQRARLTTLAPPGVLARWRRASGERVDRVFRGDAPLARALLVADTRQLSPSIRDRFAAAGLAHVLSISGLHVGILALALELLVDVLRLPRRAGEAGALVVVAVYVALIGAPAPAVRSAAMLGARAASRWLQRPTSPWAIVALGAALPLAAPRTVLDPGYQLSVLGVAALVCADALLRRLDVPDGWPRALAAAMAGSVLASVGSAPLVAWHFGRVSLVAPVADLAAGPIVALAQPMLFAALALAPFAPAATFVADATHPLLAALDRVADAAAALPGAGLGVHPSAAGAVLAATCSAAILAAAASAYPWRSVVVAAAAAVALVWHPLLPAVRGMTELHAIDVGQGDAIALRTPHGRWVLFDAGGAWQGRGRGRGSGGGGDAGKSIVIPYLARRGGTLDVLVLSHPHTDHVGGAASVLRQLRPRLYVDPGFAGASESYRASLLAARAAHVVWRRVHPGDSLVVDGVTISLLAPDSAWTAALRDPNLASTVALVRAGEVRFLLVGDAELPEERWLVARYGEALRADVLKVGHHGSSTSSGDELLDAVRPRMALVSVGAGNMYGHPSPDVMARLARRGVRVMRTDALGTVVVRTDGVRVQVEADGDSWDLPRSLP